MPKFLRILQQKSTWAGIAGIATGVVLILNGNVTEGVQTVIGGVSIIFIREAIAKSTPTK